MSAEPFALAAAGIEPFASMFPGLAPKGCDAGPDPDQDQAEADQLADGAPLPLDAGPVADDWAEVSAGPTVDELNAEGDTLAAADKPAALVAHGDRPRIVTTPGPRPRHAPEMPRQTITRKSSGIGRWYALAAVAAIELATGGFVLEAVRGLGLIVGIGR